MAVHEQSSDSAPPQKPPDAGSRTVALGNAREEIPACEFAYLTRQSPWLRQSAKTPPAH